MARDVASVTVRKGWSPVPSSCSVEAAHLLGKHHTGAVWKEPVRVQRNEEMSLGRGTSAKIVREDWGG